MTDTTFGNAPTSPPSEDTSAWEARIKEARRKGDPAETIVIATAAADAIEQRMEGRNALSESDTSALKAVQRFTYNAAADAWPGWQTDGHILDKQHLVTAKGLAERSASLVNKLQLGGIQQATGIWLVAAFDLALGNFDAAATTFPIASQQYQAAQAPGLALLVDGYLVVARGLGARRTRQEITQDLEIVFAQISSGGYEDGNDWIQQLSTALVVFTPTAMS